MLEYINTVKGASFCQVDKIIHNGHDIFDITIGNQKWQGAAPNLIRRAVRIRKELAFS
jgi:hypothetical protein